MVIGWYMEHSRGLFGSVGCRMSDELFGGYIYQMLRELVKVGIWRMSGVVKCRGYAGL